MYSTLFKVDCYFDYIIINAENTPSHKYTVENGRKMLRASSG